ncbi:uncharacterized protein LACBIDRAFT_326986 [Laccaria bicolor S238N-H82]|uniref:Predicted protein n=1 Tax=Laccaria bicolor (strain S238N-H82 / ATCC MYA-4686) TaxID=486041 RepID=B0DAB5_LACBS|nr:uncharacterized protein LACBIDRAFT_326986 [Laccaria bicolor S238N-H82]EDR08500.1 predicted protein [Laccaria bicolor S238N-H82]|eukprot:XP_001880725.1 predicted protein [Laccaria bicolor S238N-H82]
MTASAPPYTHIFSQTKQNVEFLISQKQLSQNDGQDILNKLSAAFETPSSDKSAPSPILSRARALWGFNEARQDPNDLSFRAGDIIDLIEDKNPDWWTGRCNGKEGVFPSSYVEKLPRVTTPPRSNPFPYQEKFPVTPVVPAPLPPYPPPSQYQGPPNQYQAPPNPYYQGSGQGNPYPQYGAPPPPSRPSTVIVEQQQPPKKHKFGGSLGNTLAHSAAGGVGFGAGSAIGGGIIDALF